MTLSLLLEASASLLTAVANHSHLCDVLPVVCQLHLCLAKTKSAFEINNIKKGM